MAEDLAAQRVALEVCPTSTIATRVVDRLEDDPGGAARVRAEIEGYAGAERGRAAR